MLATEQSEQSERSERSERSLCRSDGASTRGSSAEGMVCIDMPSVRPRVVRRWTTPVVTIGSGGVQDRGYGAVTIGWQRLS
jgi:hypothetical protein